MTIRDYIQNQIFGHRAQEHGALWSSTTHPPLSRHCLIHESRIKCRVIDASQSVIEQREAGDGGLGLTGGGQIHQLVIWVPAVRPEDNEGKQRDPVLRVCRDRDGLSAR